MERGKGDGTLRLDENGNPNYRFNPLLADLPAHVRLMDKAGIDIAVLSCGSGPQVFWTSFLRSNLASQTKQRCR